jgi:phosphohistidine phosphatase SixA
MRRRIVVMRHGEALAAGQGSRDRDRRLSELGRQQTAWVGSRLKELGWVPDLIIASDAVRTLETTSQLALGLSAAIPFEAHADLYLGGFDAMAYRVSLLAEDLATVAVVGHNPGWAEAVAVLSGQPVALNPGDAVLLASRAEQSWGSIAQTQAWVLEGLIRAQDQR